MKIKRSKHSYSPIKEEGRQVGRFSLIGVVNTVIDFGVYNAAFIAFGLMAIPAHLISTTVAMAFSFIANKTYVFGSGSRRILAQAALFVLVTAAGLYIIQTGVISLLLYAWTVPLDVGYAFVSLVGLDGLLPEQFVFNNGAKAAATVLSMAWNYVLYRTVVFNDRRSHVFDSIGDWFADHRHHMVLGGVILMATVFRFWQLDTIPPGLHPDEAADGLIASSITEGGIGALNGASGITGAPFYLLQAAGVAILGNTLLALRIVPALLGVAAVIFTYVAVHSWFSRRTALVTAFLMASAPWAVHMSRISDHMVLAAVLAPLGMWAAARAIRTNKALWYVALGAVIGGLWYGGVPYYSWAALILLLGAFARRYYRDRLKYSLQPILIVALSALIVGTPRLVFGILSGSVTRGQETASAVLAAFQAPIETLSMLWHKSVAAFGMFHLVGDQNVLYNLPGAPLLNGFVGILFVLGVLLAIRRFRDIRYAALMAVGASVFLVNLFGGSGPASSVSNIAMLPIVYTLSSIGLIELFARWRGVFPRNVLALQCAVLVILVVLGVSTLHNWRHYFTAWANMPETFEVYHEHTYQTARHIEQIENSSNVNVITDRESGRVLSYLARSDYTRLEPGRPARTPADASSVIIVPRGKMTGDVRFPEYRARDVYSSKRPGTILYTVYTP